MINSCQKSMTEEKIKEEANNEILGGREWQVQERGRKKLIRGLHKYPLSKRTIKRVY